MESPYLGTIMMWAADYAPRGWAFCYGQVLDARQHKALFVMLRETFGGDGETSFRLPDFVGRTPVGAGLLGSGEEIALGAASPVLRGGQTPGCGLLRGALAVNYVICIDGRFPEPA
ncbi:phage tail protein [Salinarimonas rosea]|uniref:phage tail protein n=1 Tax=Salinarimonas rosea TaxID=552063 RepID=UPI0004259E5D|nr:tail fiber protein [Salinarimonas rosea]